MSEKHHEMICGCSRVHTDTPSPNDRTIFISRCHSSMCTYVYSFTRCVIYVSSGGQRDNYFIFLILDRSKCYVHAHI